MDLLLGVGVCLALLFVGWRYWTHKASERWSWALAAFDAGRVQVWEDEGVEGHAVL